jgi:hypothetical protein
MLSSSSGLLGENQDRMERPDEGAALEELGAGEPARFVSRGVDESVVDAFVDLDFATAWRAFAYRVDETGGRLEFD